MPRYEPGLTFLPSPQAIEIVRERLQRAGCPITEAAARGLLEAVLAVEGPRMQTIARGIVHGSLETIRQTAEVALSALKEGRSERGDLVGVVKQHLSAEPASGHRQRDLAAHRREPAEQESHPAAEDTRPVFKRPRGR
jgi:hypothetical protein